MQLSPLCGTIFSFFVFIKLKSCSTSCSTRLTSSTAKKPRKPFCLFLWAGVWIFSIQATKSRCYRGDTCLTLFLKRSTCMHCLTLVFKEELALFSIHKHLIPAPKDCLKLNQVSGVCWTSCVVSTRCLTYSRNLLDFDFPQSSSMMKILLPSSYLSLPQITQPILKRNPRCHQQPCHTSPPPPKKKAKIQTQLLSLL